MDDWDKFNETALPEKKNFIATSIQKILQMQNACMRKKLVKTLKLERQVNIMIFILEVIHYFWLMFLKTSEKCA